MEEMTGEEIEQLTISTFYRGKDCLKMTDVSLYKLRCNSPTDANQDAHNQTINCRIWGFE